MKLLIIGGGRFLGRTAVTTALAAGHQVTTFSRGRSAVPAGAEQLCGDRERPADLAQLRGREFDAVIDTCGFVPRVVGESARLLAESAGHYVFVSSISAYRDWPHHRIRDDSATYDCAPGAGPEDGDYGVLKAGCERAVDEHFAGRSTQVRSGLLVGPYDDTGRLTWWLSRVANGGEVLAPGNPDQPLSVVDVRDLAAWMIHCGQSRLTGAYAATAPKAQTTFAGLLEACRAATGSSARFVWASDDFLVAERVDPWVELPLWLPPADGAAVWDVDTVAAELAGLSCRSLQETVTDTWRWLRAGPPPAQRDGTPRHGIDPIKERALLSRWQVRSRTN
jgi:2'-hydroxyisoflavone reductase